MKAIISVALLLTIVSTRQHSFFLQIDTNRTILTDSKMMSEQNGSRCNAEKYGTKKGEIISTICKPLVDGLLGSGAFGVTWKGLISLTH